MSGIFGSSGGVASPHGAADHSDITRSIWLPTRGTIGLDAGTSTTVAALPDQTLAVALADAATQGVQWSPVPIPRDAVAAQPLNIVIFWAPAATDAVAHTVRWSVDAIRYQAGTDISTAGTTTAFTGASAARTQNLMVIEAAQQALASVTAGDIIRLDLRRIGADAADTYVGVVNLLGCEIQYTANQ